MIIIIISDNNNLMIKLRDRYKKKNPVQHGKCLCIALNEQLHTRYSLIANTAANINITASFHRYYKRDSW